MKRLLLLVVVVVVASSSYCAAQSHPRPQHSRVEIDQAVAAFMAKNGIPGVSIAVVVNGEPAWSNGYGKADLENSVPATAATEYRLASVSKPITAVAIMQLAQSGKLDLDAPVQRYCPVFPDKGKKITTREVLGHLGGIRHYKSDSPSDPDVSSTKRYASINEAMAIFANDPLIADPGTEFHYSTFGYTLMGCVLEGVSNAKYLDYLHAHIFAPAGMVNTRDDDEHAIIPHRAQGYQKDKSGDLLNSDLADTSYKVPGGGLISDAEDMARFESAILTDKLMERKTRDQMWTPQADSSGRRSGYALGWGISDGKELGFQTAGHSGGQQRVDTAILVAPDRNDGVVVLTNLEGGDAMALARELLKIVVNAKR